MSEEDVTISKQTSRLGEPSKKKNYEILDMWQNSLTPPPPREVWTQKVWTLRMRSDPPPPPSVVWTFGQKKFVSRKSINKLMACLERVQWCIKTGKEGVGGTATFCFVLKQVECRL